MSEAAFCDRCGQPLGRHGGTGHGGTGHGGTGHGACRAARELEPPRYCARCGRRMVVKVTPSGWSGRCSRHGPVSSTA